MALGLRGLRAAGGAGHGGSGSGAAPAGGRFQLTTNLCRDQVAGPGVTLHFNFQVFLIIWAFLATTASW